MLSALETQSGHVCPLVVRPACIPWAFRTVSILTGTGLFPEADLLLSELVFNEARPQHQGNGWSFGQDRPATPAFDTAFESL